MKSADKPRETSKKTRTPARSVAPAKNVVARAATKATPHRAPAEKTKASASATAAAPTEEEIRFRAYQIYLSRGCVHGRDKEDWTQAELELRALRNSSR